MLCIKQSGHSLQSRSIKAHEQNNNEQNNKFVKKDSGAVGLLQNTKALLRWMVAGPKLVRVIVQFEDNIAWMEVQGKLPGPISSSMSILHLHKSNLPLRLVLSFKYMYLKIWEIHSWKKVKTSWFLKTEMLLIQL